MLPPYSNTLPACGSWNGINQTDRQVDCGGRWRYGQRGRRKDGVIVGGRRGKGGGGTHMIDVAVYHRERSGLNSGCMQSGWGTSHKVQGSATSTDNTRGLIAQGTGMVHDAATYPQEPGRGLIHRHVHHNHRAPGPPTPPPSM